MNSHGHLPDLYRFQDYKLYLTAWIESKSSGGHGERGKLAKAAGCNSAYVSHVLNGDSHFNLEQAAGLNSYLVHSEEQSHYFYLLIQLARAGNRQVRDYFERQVKVIQTERLQITKRVKVKKTLSIADQTTYYSTWYFAAIHMLLLMPGYSNAEKISQYLGLSRRTIAQVIEFLTNAGLLEFKGGKYISGISHLHLIDRSPLIGRHHSNWRMQALRSLEKDVNIGQDLHYSSVVAVARADVDQVKSLLIEAVEKIRAVVKDSKEDSLFCYNLDLFEVGDSGSKSI